MTGNYEIDPHHAYARFPISPGKEVFWEIPINLTALEVERLVKILKIMTTEDSPNRVYHTSINDDIHVTVEVIGGPVIGRHRDGVAAFLQAVAKAYFEHPLVEPAPNQESTSPTPPARTEIPRPKPPRSKTPSVIRAFAKERLLAGLSDEAVAREIRAQFKTKTRGPSVWYWRHKWMREGVVFPRPPKQSAGDRQVSNQAGSTGGTLAETLPTEPRSIDQVFAFAKGRLLNKESPADIVQAIWERFSCQITEDRIKRWADQLKIVSGVK